MAFDETTEEVFQRNSKEQDVADIQLKPAIQINSSEPLSGIQLQNSDKNDDLLVHTTSKENPRESVRKHRRTGKDLTRKRKRDPSSWKKEIRKTLRQSGQQYVGSNNKIQRGKFIKDCKRDHTVCRFKCKIKISVTDEETLHKQHWILNDQEKRLFYSQTTIVENKKRCHLAENPKLKKKSYSYYFIVSDELIRVCKEFYLCTLDIDEKRIRNHHSTKNKTTGTPQQYKRGKVPSQTVPNSIKDSVRKHIQSIPRIDSHYCRKSTNKEYIQENLNMTILYEKYCEKCVLDNVVPAKKSMYRTIFNTEFNIEVHTLKKDRCDKCESMKMNPSPNLNETALHEIYTKNKLRMNLLLLKFAYGATLVYHRTEIVL
ncbi:uncharacterized protein LOC136078746 [Hydra vulgaris]|uniref:Uncharacterized protein LOC136078746 n=1 Tax=Hydra vulgaris TaxID=6087 RepID=A0ABM4BNE7_HYDVU